MGLWNKGGTEREVILREQKDWKKINQKWASMVSHMSLLNVFSALVVWLSQWFITISCFVLRFSGFWGFGGFFSGNASQKSKQPTAWTLHFIWGQDLCYFYKSIKSKLYEYSYSKHRFTATLSHSAMSDPPPHANTVKISLAWVQLPLSSFICQYILLIEGKRSGYSLK